MQPIVDFVGAEAKLARAIWHINELKSEIANFLSLGKHRIVVAIDPETGNENLRIQEDEPLPERWSLVLGDATHNLRSALDILACDLVRRAGHDIKGVYFPTARSEQLLRKAIKNNNIRKAGVRVKAAILEIQPYRSGNGEILRLLHELDIADKHHLVLPVSRIASLSELSFNNARIYGGTILIENNISDIVGPQGVINSASGVVKNIKFSGKIEIAFGGEIFASQSITETLTAISVKVREVIDRFAL